MAGALKPARLVGGVALLTRVLAAVPTADPVVVVGPPELAGLLPARARLTREDPPGGGPVAAAQAGLACLLSAVDPGARTEDPFFGIGAVALLAADLPFLTPAVVTRLVAGLPGADGAMLVDPDGHRQWLCAAWRPTPLAARLARAGPGASLRATLSDLRINLVELAGSGAPAWFDCDTEADLQAAEEWSHADSR